MNLEKIVINIWKNIVPISLLIILLVLWSNPFLLAENENYDTFIIITVCSFAIILLYYCYKYIKKILLALSSTTIALLLGVGGLVIIELIFRILITVPSKGALIDVTLFPYREYLVSTQPQFRPNLLK